MDGSQLMAKAIERQGVKTAFGLPGHLEYFFGALQDQGIRLIYMRHEGAWASDTADFAVAGPRTEADSRGPA